jgi:hypothetical protein
VLAAHETEKHESVRERARGHSHETNVMAVIVVVRIGCCAREMNVREPLESEGLEPIACNIPICEVIPTVDDLLQC